MNRLKHIGAILALIAVVGCATNRVAYNTLATVEAVTTESTLAYFEAVAKGKASVKGVPAVAQAYDNFQVVFSTAVALARFNTNSIAPVSVIAAATEVENTIIQAKEAK